MKLSEVFPSLPPAQRNEPDPDVLAHPTPAEFLAQWAESLSRDALASPAEKLALISFKRGIESGHIGALKAGRILQEIDANFENRAFIAGEAK